MAGRTKNSNFPSTFFATHRPMRTEYIKD